MLTGTVDALERLFMEQTDKFMAFRDLLHDLHGNLVMIYRDISGIIDRCHLMLRGRCLVMLRLRHDPQLPELLIQLLHKCLDPGLDRAEIMII